jgi:hypothetical protein
MNADASPAPTPQAGREDRSVAALAAAAALVVLVVVLVLFLGVARPPELASLAEQPEPAPSAAVVWMTWGPDGACLSVAHPDGSSEELVCNRDGAEVRAWTDEGIVLWGYGARDEVRIVDPRTGETTTQRTAEAEVRPGPGVAEDVSARRDAGVLIVTRRDTGDVVWEVAAPEGYEVLGGAVSPDGDWIAMLDSTDRLLVVPADGTAAPRVWVEDAARWSVPVWEGTPLDELGT